MKRGKVAFSPTFLDRDPILLGSGPNESEKPTAPIFLRAAEKLQATVTPAKAGVRDKLDSCLRRNDFLKPQRIF